jgi:hypothetical protein
MTSVLLDLWNDLSSWLAEMPDNALLSPKQVRAQMKQMEEEYI